MKNQWIERKVDFAHEIKEYPDLQTARCPYCKRYHTTIYFHGEPFEEVKYCPNCGKRVSRYV